MNENYTEPQVPGAEAPAIPETPQAPAVPEAAQVPAYQAPYNAPAPYGAPQVPYGMPQAPYGAPQAPYGAPQGPYGAPQAPYGAPQAPYGAPQAPYGAPQAPYGAPQPPYGAYQAPYGAPAYAPQPPMEDMDGLCTALLNAVRFQLKAPMTAVLCPKEQLIIRQNGATYEVEGLVHSQNSYGAMIATDFSATVARSNGFWSVLKATVGVKSAKNYAKNFAVNYIAISIFVGVMALIGTGILFAVFGLL